MSSLFKDETAFNGDVSAWDVSSATNMNKMFMSTSSFNQDLNNWDVSSVTDMAQMFEESSIYYGIGDWDVSSVVTTEKMFQRAEHFTGYHPGFPKNWLSLQTANRMFAYSKFNYHDLVWQTPQLTSMRKMFYNAQEFNNRPTWDTSKVTSMKYMFAADTGGMRIEGNHYFDLRSMPSDGLDNIFDNVLYDAEPVVKLYGTNIWAAKKDGQGTMFHLNNDGSKVWTTYY